MEKTGREAGIDLGLMELGTIYDGSEPTSTVKPENAIENQHFYRRAEERLAKLQRELKRKTPGSANYEKTRVKLAKLHQRVANQREYYLHNASIDLIRRYDLICIEDLDVKEMMRRKLAEEKALGKRNHGKSVADVGLGEFIRQLNYKGKWYGKEVKQIGRYEPSTQLCSCCGYLNTDIRGEENLPIRAWTCPQCGTFHHRDLNAAKNILEMGKKPPEEKKKKTSSHKEPNPKKGKTDVVIEVPLPESV